MLFNEEMEGMGKYEIIEQLARDSIVEQMIKNICKCSRSDLDDLAQLIYEALLNYDEEKLQRLNREGSMRYFLARIIKNQFYSDHSLYYYDYRRLQRVSCSTKSAETIIDDETDTNTHS